MTHRYSESGGGFCGICDDRPGEGEHAGQVVLGRATTGGKAGGIIQVELPPYAPKPDPTFAELQARSHQQSKDKGFHDYQPASERELTSLNAERIALMHSELSEALEELRKGGDTNHNYYPRHRMECEISQFQAGTGWGTEPIDLPVCTCTPKPEGVPSELADVVIRIMDYCGANDIDLLAAVVEKLDYNATRGKMHGGKKF